MRVSIMCFIIGFLVSSTAAGQVRPDQFPEELNPNDTNFEVYSQKDGNVRRARLKNLKKYFTPDIELMPILSIPSETGNADNRMQYVIDPNDDVWFIDADGDAVKLRGEGKIYSRQTVALFSGSQFTIPADAVDLRIYIGGLLQEPDADYTRSGSIINFNWTPPGLRLTLIYRQ